MARIYLVRHGQAAAGFDADHDPGLNDLGHAQSKAVCERLGQKDPMAVISSPLRRCRETAQPLCDFWKVTPRIVPEVAEIPSPTDDLTKRTEWLRSIMPGTWSDVDDPSLADWRERAIGAVARLTQDTVVFSHFIAINVIIGHVRNDDRMVVFRPDNCSVTAVDVRDGNIGLVELGAEASTQVG